MFTTIGNQVWAFDCEWIPDARAGRILHKLPPAAPDEEVLPTREDFGTVYNFIRRQTRFGEEEFTLREMLLRDRAVGEIGYIKLHFIIRVLLELNIVGITELPDERFAFKVYSQSKRADLEKSVILRRLRAAVRKA